MNKWTMATGERIAVKDMDNSHLMNTIKFIKRTSYRTFGNAYDGGEVDFVPPRIYKDMCIEASKRNILGNFCTALDAVDRFEDQHEDNSFNHYDYHDPQMEV